MHDLPMVKGRSRTRKVGIFYAFNGLGLELANCRYFHISLAKNVSWHKLTSKTLDRKGQSFKVTCQRAWMYKLNIGKARRIGKQSSRLPRILSLLTNCWPFSGTFLTEGNSVKPNSNEILNVQLIRSNILNMRTFQSPLKWMNICNSLPTCKVETK